MSSQRKVASGVCSFPSYQSVGEIYGSTRIYRKFVSERFAHCASLNHKNLQGHFGCVNAVEFSSRGGEYIASGGDDRRVLLWNVEASVYGKTKPTCMKGQHRSNIFCTLFDSDNSHIYSAGNDQQVLRHDLQSGEVVGTYFHDYPIYGLSIHPEDDSIFLSACDDGQVLLTDIRVRPASDSHQCIAGSNAAFHAAVFNPVDSKLVATANSQHGIQIWDTRKPMRYLQHYDRRNGLCAMCVKWSSCGNFLTALRRRLPPALYRLDRHTPVVEFEHPGYSNVCTMKSNCFAGDKDQDIGHPWSLDKPLEIRICAYIVSGSDDFNVYVWKIPDVDTSEPSTTAVGRAFLVLGSHRSIVNQVRFNPRTHMLCSAGVEKVVKVWSPFPLPGVHGETLPSESRQGRRELYSHNDYVDLVLGSGRPLTHEYDECSVDEDPRMLAFFDSLIQRELSGWHSDSTGSLSPDEFYMNFVHPDSSGSSDDDTVGISLGRLTEILSRQANHAGERSAESEEQNMAAGVLRRLRLMNSRRMFRELLHSTSTTSSASESSGEGGDEIHQPVVLPSPPGSESDEVEQAPVAFRRRRAARRRRYRRAGPSRRRSNSSTSSDDGDDDGDNCDGNVDDDEDQESISAVRNPDHFNHSDSGTTTTTTTVTTVKMSAQESDPAETEREPISNNNHASETIETQLPTNGKFDDDSREEEKPYLPVNQKSVTCTLSVEQNNGNTKTFQQPSTADGVSADRLRHPDREFDGHLVCTPSCLCEARTGRQEGQQGEGGATSGQKCSSCTISKSGVDLPLRFSDCASDVAAGQCELVEGPNRRHSTETRSSSEYCVAGSRDS